MASIRTRTQHTDFDQGDGQGLFSWCTNGLCKTGLNPDTSTDESKSKGFHLTGQHRVAVVRTWEKLSEDIATLGINTLNRLFNVEPSIKECFYFQDIPDNVLQLEPMFRQHAFWFVQAICTVMENLDGYGEGMEDMFLEIGASHVSVPAFKKNYFKLVPEVWCYVWEDQLKGRFSSQAVKAWRRIFGYIVSTIDEGYLKAYHASRTVISVAAEKEKKRRKREEKELREKAKLKKSERRISESEGEDDDDDDFDIPTVTEDSVTVEDEASSTSPTDSNNSKRESEVLTRTTISTTQSSSTERNL